MTAPLPAPEPALPHPPRPLQAHRRPSDAELAARARRGDDAGLRADHATPQPPTVQARTQSGPGRREAEDVLQEAYLRAYARLGELAERRALAAWLARIVANEALGRLRAAARVVSLDDLPDGQPGRTTRTTALDRGPASDQPDPERLAASSELRRLLEAAVDALPEEFRTVFVLREVEGLSTAETAACLAIRPETVKTRLYRARRLLQERLGGGCLPPRPRCSSSRASAATGS